MDDRERPKWPFEILLPEPQLQEVPATKPKEAEKPPFVPSRIPDLPWPNKKRNLPN